MPEATSENTTAQSQTHALRLTLNTDGQRHPLQNALTAFTFIVGILAFAAGLVVRFHLLATVFGGAAFAVGMYAQMISATREERMFIVAGIIAAFVGLALGIAHGGL
jgi:hypothetical protein